MKLPRPEIIHTRPGTLRAALTVPATAPEALHSAVVEPLRVAFFAQHPRVLVLYVPEGAPGVPTLPALRAPFNRYDLAMAFSDAKIDVRIAESAPGAWGAAVHQLVKDAKSERIQKERQTRLAQVRLYRGAAEAETRDRATLLERLTKQEERIKSLKESIAASKGSHGSLAEGIRNKLYGELREAQDGMAEIHAALRAIKKAEHERRMTEGREFANAFVDKAKELLDRETFQAIFAEAQVMVGGEDEEDDIT